MMTTRRNLIAILFLAAGACAGVAEDVEPSCLGGACDEFDPWPACADLALMTVPERSYQRIEAPLFDGRFFVYVPGIHSNYLKTSFEAFDLWLVEGVYGGPFLDARGTLTEETFELLRGSGNVRATPIRIVPDEDLAVAQVSFGLRTQVVVEAGPVNLPYFRENSIDVVICE